MTIYHKRTNTEKIQDGGVLIRCPHCGYVRVTFSKMLNVNCSSCRSAVNIEKNMIKGE